MSALAGVEVPVCDCHQEPMFWHRDRRRKRRGYWQCSVRKQESGHRYEQSEIGRATRVRYRDGDGRLALAHRKMFGRYIGLTLGVSSDAVDPARALPFLLEWYKSWKALSGVASGARR